MNMYSGIFLQSLSQVVDNLFSQVIVYQMVSFSRHCQLDTCLSWYKLARMFWRQDINTCIDNYLIILTLPLISQVITILVLSINARCDQSEAVTCYVVCSFMLSADGSDCDWTSLDCHDNQPWIIFKSLSSSSSLSHPSSSHIQVKNKECGQHCCCNPFSFAPSA